MDSVPVGLVGTVGSAISNGVASENFDNSFLYGATTTSTPLKYVCMHITNT